MARSLPGLMKADLEMTLPRFVVRNVLRNKRRAILTILSISFSLALLQILLTFLDTLVNPAVEDESALRLWVGRSTSIVDMMPASYKDKIQRIPGVEYVVPMQWFNGIYREQANFFANMAVEPEHLFDVYSEQKVTPEALTAFLHEKDAAVVGEDLMSRFNWKVGDRVTLLGTIFPADLDLKIVGTYRANRYQNMFYFRYDYFSEALGGFNQVGSFAIRVKNTGLVAQVADAIDATFHNSAAETKTQTEKAFMLSFVSMLGNVRAIVGSVALVVVFTMLLVSVSTMSMAIRERLREVAILRAIGYSSRTVFWLILGEALFMAALGVFIGLGMAESLRFVNMDQLTRSFVDKYAPPYSVYAIVVSSGVLMGLLSGIIPGWQAARMGILNGMRRIE